MSLVSSVVAHSYYDKESPPFEAAQNQEGRLLDRGDVCDMFKRKSPPITRK